MREAAIVLAAGSGSRFGDRKQFLELAPRLRLVDAAVAAAGSAVGYVVIVLPAGRDWDGATVDAAVAGGATRAASVRAGLEAMPAGVDVVHVHDAAHPLAPPGLFRSLAVAIAEGADAALPWLPVTEVVKRRHSDGSVRTAGRDGLGLAQLPMAFRRSALVAAHAAGHEAWEDSQLVEEAGGRVMAVAGDPTNLHVVTADDLAVARALYACRSS